MHKPIIAVITLVSAYAVANILETPTPPVMQPAATATAPVPEAVAVVETPEPPGEVLRSTELAPAQVGVRIPAPRGSGFCADGSCGPAQASRQYTYSADGRYVLMQAADGRQFWQEVQRPVRSGLFGGRFRGRR